MDRDEVVSCLFCASPCPIDINDDSCQYQEIVTCSDGPPPSPPLFEEDSPPVREQLKSLFILRRILHIPNEGLAQFLGEREGSSQPELWAKVCSSCGPLVRQFYDTFKEVARLERILEMLETELKGRIVESKEKELKGPTAKVLEEIRSHVLQELEGAENEFDKDFAEYLVQELVVEDPVASGELMDLSNLVIPTFSISEPYSGGSSRSKPPVDPDEFHGSVDDLEWIGHVVDDSNSLSPVRPRKRKRTYKTRKRSGKENTGQRYTPSPRKKRRKLNVPQKPPAVYSCRKCPYKTTQSISFRKHGFCHEWNSGAERCEECLAYFLPYKMHSHRYNCKLLIQKTVGSERMLNAEARKRKKHSFIESNPNYLLYRRGKAMNHYYLCRKCPYETSQHARIEAHVKLHEEGTGVACGECEWYLRPEMMEIHEKNNHSGRRERQEEKGRKEEEEKKEIEEKEDSESSAPLKYQCSQCPYETRHKQLFDNHLAVHQKKEGQEKCDACGWVFSKMGLLSHRQFCRGSRSKTSLGSPSGRDAVKETEQKLNGGDQRVNYACSQCPYEGRNKTLLDGHQKLHQRKEDVYTCEGCQIVYSKYGLISHRPYCGRTPVKHVCAQCPYQNNNKKLVEKHRELHLWKNGTETCEGCQVVFSKTGLISHRLFCKRRASEKR